MSTSKAGKQALKDGKLGEGFEKLIKNYVLPLGVRARAIPTGRLPCDTIDAAAAHSAGWLRGRPRATSTGGGWEWRRRRGDMHVHAARTG